MPNAMRLLALSAILLVPAAATALQINVHPKDPLYLNVANTRFNVHDLIAHLVVVKNTSSETVTLEELRYQLFSDQQMMQEVKVPTEQIVGMTQEVIRLKQQGMQVMADALCPPEAIGTAKLSTKKQLAANEALTSRNIFLSVQGIPTRLRVAATYKSSSGKTGEAVEEISVVQYKSSNQYIFPLEGEWYMQAVPNVTSHHRWMFQTEFGIDFLKVNDKGSPYKTDGTKAEDYFGFGQPVLAAADGVVVRVINDATQNWDAWFPREGESEEEFERRSMQYQLDALKKDVYRAITGNVVVIEHPNKEFSAYAHLKTGSVLIKVGDRVEQGQKIGQVGDTGDYYRPHLHFQISNANDLLSARSLPFEFNNLISNKPELGHFGRIKAD